jgi:hypothetical protein
MGLITETNAQYYAGQQTFISDGTANQSFDCTFNIDVVSAFNSTGVQIGSASNYVIYVDNVLQNEDLSYISNVDTNTITLRTTPILNAQIIVQLKQFAINQNYNSYAYISLDDVINNFMVGYVGYEKVISRVNKTDVIFHAKRALQEFSYDLLKVLKSQELTIPPSLTVPIPQDYVNYVRVSWVDGNGGKHIIYPTRVTSNPTELPIQRS